MIEDSRGFARKRTGLMLAAARLSAESRRCGRFFAERLYWAAAAGSVYRWWFAWLAALGAAPGGFLSSFKFIARCPMTIARRPERE